MELGLLSKQQPETEEINLRCSFTDILRLACRVFVAGKAELGERDALVSAV